MNMTVLQSFETTIITLIERAKISHDTDQSTLAVLLPLLIAKYKKLMEMVNPDYGSLMNAPQEDVILHSQSDQISFKLAVFESMAKSFSVIKEKDREMIINFLIILAQNPKELPKEKGYLWV